MKWRNCRLSTKIPDYQLGWAVLAAGRQLDIRKHNFLYIMKYRQPRLQGCIVKLACLHPLGVSKKEGHLDQAVRNKPNKLLKSLAAKKTNASLETASTILSLTLLCISFTVENNQLT